MSKEFVHIGRCRIRLDQIAAIYEVISDWDSSEKTKVVLTSGYAFSLDTEYSDVERVLGDAVAYENHVEIAFPNPMETK